jgi:NitT/TauT family transport system permease protein
MRGSLRRALFLLCLVAVWAAASKSGLFRPWLFPSPAVVFERLRDGFVDRSIPWGIAVSLRRLFVGYSVSLGAGVALGLALARSPLLRETVGSLVTGLQALPSICWLPLAILWFGLSEAAIQFVVIGGSVFSITVATEAGVRNVSPLYIRAARTMGARGATLYLRVILPAALPSILSGMRLGWTFAWRSLMGAELLYVSGGLGQLLATGREVNDMAMVMAVMVAIVIIGLTFEGLIFDRVEASVRERWGTDRA